MGLPHRQYCRRQHHYRRTPALIRLVLLVWSVCGALLLLLPSSCTAQESPFTEFPAFTESNSTFRTNVCGQQALVANGTLPLRDALRGLNLSVAITNYQSPGGALFFTLVDNKIPTENLGLNGVIMDELARRAGFQWRHSFVGIDPPTNRSWGDLLDWKVHYFDIAADYWARSAERMAHGVAFPHGWYEGGITFAQLRSDDTHDPNAVRLWTFLHPFQYTVWLSIVVAIAGTGMVYFFMERLRDDSDERDLENKPFGSIFLASMAFTGHLSFQPGSNAARLLTWSWSFWSLILAAAYTANMASFLVSKQQTPTLLRTLDEAVQSQSPICVQRGAAVDEIITAKYPQMVLVRKQTEAGMFQALRQPWYGGGGGCAAVLTNLGTVDSLVGKAEINYDCRVVTSGRILMNLPAGFATSVDAGVFCTSLLHYVLDVHMQEMRADGFIDEAWQNHLAKSRTIDCSSKNAKGGGGNNLSGALATTDSNTRLSLTMRNMGGIFITHAMLSMLALAVALWQYFLTKYNRPEKRLRPLLVSSLRNMNVKGDTDSFDRTTRGSTLPGGVSSMPMRALTTRGDKQGQGQGQGQQQQEEGQQQLDRIEKAGENTESTTLSSESFRSK